MFEFSLLPFFINGFTSVLIPNKEVSLDLTAPCVSCWACPDTPSHAPRPARPGHWNIPEDQECEYNSVLNMLTLWSDSQAWNPSSTPEVVILGQVRGPQISGLQICKMEIMVVLVYDYRAIPIKSSSDFFVLHQCLCIQKTQATEAWLLSKSHCFKGGTQDDSCKQKRGNNGSARIPNSHLNSTNIYHLSTKCQGWYKAQGCKHDHYTIPPSTPVGGGGKRRFKLQSIGKRTHRGETKDLWELWRKEQLALC